MTSVQLIESVRVSDETRLALSGICDQFASIATVTVLTNPGTADEIDSTDFKIG
jgi:hypothetical protein